MKWEAKEKGSQEGTETAEAAGGKESKGRQEDKSRKMETRSS